MCVCVDEERTGFLRNATVKVFIKSAEFLKIPVTYRQYFFATCNYLFLYAASSQIRDIRFVKKAAYLNAQNFSYHPNVAVQCQILFLS